METEKRVVEPIPGFSREIGLYLANWERIRAQLREIVSDLTDKELSKRILPNTNQIGNLILHLGEAEAWWIHSIVAGKELDEEAKKFAHLEDTIESDFAGKGYSAKECLGRIDEISRRSREILTDFTDDELEKLIGYDGKTKRFEVSLRWILNHLINHEANHKGQISLLKRLLRET